VVFTYHRVNLGPKQELKQEEQASSNHITVREVDDSDAENRTRKNSRDSRRRRVSESGRT